jgi:D-alanyl-D-alanine carboxypeptidase/D-alanyl-D-alanine-endopeptidase (penicillin-binding protein 4)
MSWNNIPTRSGTGISALSVDDNELTIRVVPGAVGAAPRIEHLPYYQVENRAVTETSLSYDRMPSSDVVRLTGTIVANAEPTLLRLGIDDPAHFAAWRLRSMLIARGVRVTGEVGVRHRPLSTIDDPKKRAGAPPPRPPEPAYLARLTPPPLTEDLKRINKVSQNLHAELILRRVGLVEGTGSIADGVAAVARMMGEAGVPRTAWDLSDGSGMSTYNRMSPRGIATLLRWISAQPWGAAWRETLPVAGVDGTLSSRLKGTSLEGRLFAKTGTINATNALSGYLIAKSGRTLIFSSFANDVPEDVRATRLIDAALEMIAAEN